MALVGLDISRDAVTTIFTFLVVIAISLTVYLIAKRSKQREKKIQEAEKVAEEYGVQMSKSELKKLIDMEVKKSVEEELREAIKEEEVKRLKKNYKGLTKLKKTLILWTDERTGMGSNVTVLGKTDSYDRLSLDGHKGFYVFYYYPRHNSILVNGMQALAKAFKRGKHRIEVPEELITVGEQHIIIHAHTLMSVDAHTFRVIPPDRVELTIEENRAYRHAFQKMRDLNIELLRMTENLVRVASKSNPYRIYPDRRDYIPPLGLGMGMERDDFIPREAQEVHEDKIRNAINKLRQRTYEVEE